MMVDGEVDPAHAGMNLHSALQAALAKGGPRACGDEPYQQR